MARDSTESRKEAKGVLTWVGDRLRASNDKRRLGDLLALWAVVCDAQGEESAAFDHIAGYMCFNDGSVRDYQRHTTQFTPGKNFDNSGSCGPALVTADEVGDVSALSLTTRLNGTVVQHATTASMIYGIAEVVSYLSSFTELQVGDVVATGTPSGVGAGRTPPLWMQPGDTVEVEIERVGLLRNQIGSPK